MVGKSKIERFEDLIVWQKAMSLCREVYRVTNQGDFRMDWGLREQVRRASVSILSNISEGYERSTKLEYRRFLAIAKGSAGEVRAQLHLAKNLGYLDEKEAFSALSLCFEVSRILEGIRRSMR